MEHFCVLGISGKLFIFLQLMDLYFFSLPLPLSLAPVTQTWATDHRTNPRVIETWPRVVYVLRFNDALKFLSSSWLIIDVANILQVTIAIAELKGIFVFESNRIWMKVVTHSVQMMIYDLYKSCSLTAYRRTLIQIRLSSEFNFWSSGIECMSLLPLTIHLPLASVTAATDHRPKSREFEIGPRIVLFLKILRCA